MGAGQVSRTSSKRVTTQLSQVDPACKYVGKEETITPTVGFTNISCTIADVDGKLGHSRNHRYLESSPMLCPRSSSDPLLQALLEQGINLIVPPMTGINAGDLILSNDSRTIRKAQWSRLLSKPLTVEANDQPGFTSFNFKASAHLDGSASVSLLGRIFGFEPPKTSLAANLQKAGVSKLTLRLVAPSFCALLNLDEILELLNKEKAKETLEQDRYFIVTKVWRARGITLSTFDSKLIKSDISTNIEQQIEAEIGLKSDAKALGEYTFISDEHQIFGLTLRELSIAKNGYIDKAQDSPLAFRSETESDAVYNFIGEDVFVEYKEVES